MGSRIMVRALKIRPRWRCRHKWEAVSGVWSDYEICWGCMSERNRVARDEPPAWYVAAMKAHDATKAGPEGPANDGGS